MFVFYFIFRKHDMIYGNQIMARSTAPNQTDIANTSFSSDLSFFPLQ